MSEAAAVTTAATTASQATSTATASAAPNTTQTVVPSSQAAPISVSDWSKDLDSEMRGYVQAKGFKDVPGILDSYRNLEKFHGVPQERLLKLPERADDQAGWDATWSKLGKPATPNDYKLPKGDNPQFTEAVAGMFHEAGLTQSQAEKLSGKWDGYVSAQKQLAAQEQQAVAKQEEVSLKKEWGKAFDQNISIARKAAAQFGIDGPTIDKLEGVMGFAGIMKFLSNVGSKVGEDGFVVGASKVGGGAMTPQAAQDRMAHLKGNPDFVKRYLAKQEPEFSEMGRLHSFAYPDEPS